MPPPHGLPSRSSPPHFLPPQSLPADTPPPDSLVPSPTSAAQRVQHLLQVATNLTAPLLAPRSRTRDPRTRSGSSPSAVGAEAACVCEDACSRARLEGGAARGGGLWAPSALLFWCALSAFLLSRALSPRSFARSLSLCLSLSPCVRALSHAHSHSHTAAPQARDLDSLTHTHTHTREQDSQPTVKLSHTHTHTHTHTLQRLGHENSIVFDSCLTVLLPFMREREREREIENWLAVLLPWEK
jgi:hypothetical protein